MSLNKLGDFFLRRGLEGDADRALKAYEDCHKTLERLHQANPNDAQAARDLSVSFERLGDFFLRRGLEGDADRALKAYEDSLQIAERLHQANPNDAQAARDLSVSLNKLGDFFLRRGLEGDADRALKAYEDSLKMLERLHQANPNDAQAARDLSVSLNKLGDFFLRRGLEGDADRALKAYEDSLKTLERLHQANPNDGPGRARSVGVLRTSLGDFFLRRGLEGDADRALKAYEDSLQTRQRLHQANPNDAQAARDLSVSLEQVSAISS